jgi:hypothetical protein
MPFHRDANEKYAQGHPSPAEGMNRTCPNGKAGSKAVATTKVPNVLMRTSTHQWTRDGLELALMAGMAVAALYGQTASPPADIRVRLLDYRTGRPLKGRYVQLTLSNPNGQFGPDAVLIRSKTGADGEAAFRFKAVAAPTVMVVALDDYPCTEPEEFATEEIFQRGIVGKHADIPYCMPHTTSIPSPRTGEVVFYVHRLSLWQRIHRGFVE